MNPSDTIHIVCATDHGYVMPTGVMMRSVCDHNKGTVFHVIIDDTVSDGQQRMLSRCVDGQTVLFHVVRREQFATLPGLDGSVKEYISMATYYRLLMTEIIPRDVDKVLYLDGDIICNGSLVSLWQTDIADVAVAGAPDMSEEIQDYDRLGYAAEKGYFNAGVLLINLSYWRAHALTERFFRFLHEHPERIKYHDQDVLNIFFCDHKLHLPMCDNFQDGYIYKAERMEMDPAKYGSEWQEAVRHPVLIHFSGTVKPWFRECLHPMRGLWVKTLRETPWHGYRLTRKYPLSLRTRLGNLLRAIHILPPLPEEQSPYRVKNEEGFNEHHRTLTIHFS